MTGRWNQLLQPITAEQPCGENLEGKEALTSFDVFRLFGQARPLDTPAERGERWTPRPADALEWVQIRDKAFEALGKSKDLRVLAHLGTAALRTDGVPGFSDTLQVAAGWLETYWDHVYPLVDNDAILRRNTLSCLADPMAVVDALRRTRLVVSAQHGTFSLRDADIAAHRLAPGPSDAQVDENQVNAAFASMPIAELTQLHDSVGSAVASLRRIDAKVREAAGTEAAPAFDPLLNQLARMGQLLREQVARHPNKPAIPAGAAGAATAADVVGVAAAATPPERSALGAVRSRQDAIRALDAVSDFFKQTEPSSPIPLFLARAKRLVSKDFLEVLADVAPDAVAQARAAGGLKNE